MRIARVRITSVALLAAVLTSASCGDGTPTSAQSLPAQLLIATGSDQPYVAGVIAKVLPDGRIWVARRADIDPPSGREAAIMSFANDLVLVWRDGRTARLSDLTVGRRVMVWAAGAELRSSPPQSTAVAILVER